MYISKIVEAQYDRESKAFSKQGEEHPLTLKEYNEFMSEERIQFMNIVI